MIKNIFILLFIYGASFEQAMAKNLRASLAYLPVHSEIKQQGKPTGGFVELVKAMDDVYSQGTISIQLYPFARSISNVSLNHADFHLPMIKLPNYQKQNLPFSYASECITKVAFILYTRADKALLKAPELGQHIIDTQRGHQRFFPFQATESNNIEQGIAKLLKGRVDGYIMEQDAVDHYIRQHRIKNIRRTLYAKWDTCIVIPKGGKQAEMDNIISTTLRTLRQNGRLQAINATLHQPYEDWQPYLTFLN